MLVCVLMYPWTSYGADISVFSDHSPSYILKHSLLQTALGFPVWATTPTWFLLVFGYLYSSTDPLSLSHFRNLDSLSNWYRIYMKKMIDSLKIKSINKNKTIEEKNNY